MRRILSEAFRCMAWCLLALACQPDISDDPIPVVPFPDFIVNLSAPEYQPLQINGGHKEINSIGVRGVIVYRVDASAYKVFERNCSYRPNEACATVNVHSSLLYMVDPCCNSSFSFPEGMPSGGLATRPLRQYAAALVGAELTITDEIIN
jgi:hypothetical protein